MCSFAAGFNAFLKITKNNIFLLSLLTYLKIQAPNANLFWDMFEKLHIS